MEQMAKIKRILPTGDAEVSLLRQMQCGLSCKSCDGCPQKPAEELLALADNPLNAQPGDIVTVRPKGCGAWAAGLVFLLPCIGLLVGYLLAERLGGSQLLCIAAAFLGAVFGFVPAWWTNRVRAKGNSPEFTIVSIGR